MRIGNLVSKFSCIASTVAVAGLVFSTNAFAFPLQLTSDGVSLGFTLNTVASALTVQPNGTPNCCNVLGSAVNSDGTIIINNSSAGKNYLFNNANNQTLADAVSSASDGGFPTAMANANGTVYAGGGALRKLNHDGSTALTFSNISVRAGIWTNPTNQHLIAVGNFSDALGFHGGLIDIDVSGASPTARLINTAGSDGLTVSPDGTIVYTNSAAYLISDGSLIATYFVSGADGMGVITSSNALNGNVIVSTTNGNLVMLDPSKSFAQILIASQGGYGDFTSPDFTTGTLLVSSGDSLLRLGCGAGCGIGSGPVTPPSGNVPEPASLALMGLGIAGIAGIAVARRRKSA